MNKQNFNPEKEFKKELQKEFEGRLFPIDGLKPLFLKYYTKVVELRTPLDLGCSLDTFKSIYEGKEWNLENTPIVLNGLLSCSASELNLTSSEYVNLLEEVNSMRVVWKEIATPIQKDTFMKVSTRMKLSAKGSKSFINPKFRNN